MKKTQKVGLQISSLLLCISIITILCSCNTQDATKEVSSAATSLNQEMENIAADQVDLTFSVPKSWDDIVIIHTGADETELSNDGENTVLFILYEKTAYITNSTGYVWGLFIFTKDAFANQFGKVDFAEIVGANSYIIGTDKDHIYLLVEPTDVQFLENEKESQNQYERLQKESQSVLSDFLKNNQIIVNEKCPKSVCYSVKS